MNLKNSFHHEAREEHEDFSAGFFPAWLMVFLRGEYGFS
jgi:hypothetical protein